MRTHYPRTPHLPWSPGASRDDVRVADLTGFTGREVVVTEKLDGENTTLYADGLHARSPDSAHHPSRAWVKALQGRIGQRIPEGWRVCGENLYARHSLPYEDLDSYFYGFSVWDELHWCPGWDFTVDFLKNIGIPTPRVLWRGVFDERALRRLAVDTGRQEGYVVRTAEGFTADDFGRHVAKWVRPGHVQTGTHWMHTAVTPNRLGPRAALWDVRSGGAPDAGALLSAVGAEHGDAAAAAEVAASAGARLGDARLAGVLAGLLHREPRGTLAGRLAPALGLPPARRVADLVGLHAELHRPYPDGERRAGLVRMGYAVDLDVLHAVAWATAPDAGAREQTDWSALLAEEAGLLGSGPPAFGRAFAGLEPEAAARCRGEARLAYADGRITTEEEAVAATWRWRDGAFPRLVHLVGPSGSGKSAFARGLPGVSAYVSLDELREERGGRADQRGNGDVLREGLARLDAALAAGTGTVVWDATSLNRHQRSLVHAVARRRDALVTHAVLLVDERELTRRNATRQHPVPPGVLAAQLRRFVPPHPGEAHRTWYVGAGGTVEEEA
ncbi:kinase [Streptomyces sp. CC53]|uniref:RNA ligase family protein n=1 Tax=unclassified Streptomyces TaxID=2593676 RepID=UPI0008DE0E65|nr:MULTISPECIES: RNA ligase family protein [unclassified Streptomyces]OII61760.1 kinase [Streptomyces sp. CC53]